MTDETTGDWIECIVDKDYEIWNQYPYPIRRKDSYRIVSESIKADGYVQCSLNRKTYQKHRIIAIQFIPNPDNKPQVDHRNHQRADNRIENLRWVNNGENNKNKTGWGDHKFTFIDELPETALPLDRYNNHEFDGLFIDYESQKLYLFIDIGYRELVPCHSKGYVVYNVRDIGNKWTYLFHRALFK